MPRHLPPAVTFPVGRSARTTRYAITAWLVAALPLAAMTWTVIAGNTPAGLAGAAALWVLWLIAGWLMLDQLRQLQTSLPGQLAWRNGRWAWLDDNAAAHPICPVILWDGQDTLWLQCRAQANTTPKATTNSHNAPPRWLWLEHRMAPVHWSDLRRALYFNAQKH